MSKNLKLTYILFFIFSAVIIAWNTLTAFFKGVAVNYVGILGLTFCVLLLVFADKTVFGRIKDLFFIACGFCVLELIVYFAFEFGWINFDFLDSYIFVHNTLSSNSLKGFVIYQNVLSILGFLFFAYISFRFISEMKDKRFKFVEFLLGSTRRKVKVKKAKEVSNGSLEDKPNNKHFQKPVEEEQEVIVETEE